MTSLPFPVRRELFPVEHRFLELDGAQIHYVDEGAGDTLLLLHGNPSWSFLYRKIIAGLKDAYRCVALDFPGYGMSTAPATYGYTPREHSEMLERFVDRLGLSDLTIMVQDWGGPIGLGFAARRPELVRGLIIGNTWAWPHDRERRIRAFSWIMGGPVGEALTRGFNFVPRVFFSRGFAQPIDPEVLRLYFAPWKEPGRRAPAVIAPRQLVAASPYLAEVEADLHKLADRPALIVWGTKDFAFARPTASDSRPRSPTTAPSCSMTRPTSSRRMSGSESPKLSRRSLRSRTRPRRERRRARGRGNRGARRSRCLADVTGAGRERQRGRSRRRREATAIGATRP